MTGRARLMAALAAGITVLAATGVRAEGEEAGMAVIRRYLVERSRSPWLGYTSSYQEEQAGYTVEAVVLTDAMERIVGLASYDVDGEPLIAIDRERRRVVLNERFLGAFHRPDIPRLGSGERMDIGAVRDRRLTADPVALFSFLVESELVRTYWHVEARLELVTVGRTGSIVVGSFRGSHLYFTNEQHEEAYEFRIELDLETGILAVVGGL